jgi:FkbM family methyltransferase
VTGITYRENLKLWWPDYDQGADKCYAFVMARLKDMDRAIARTKGRLVCVQAGGHVGLWPLRLEERFKVVYTFEPDPYLFECLRKNCDGHPRIEVSQCALGDKVEVVKMIPRPTAGSWRVDPEGRIPVPQTTIDAMNLPACDALFLDVEGYEVKALQGAKATISRYRPTIMVEELPRATVGIRAHMAELNYRLVDQIHADSIYVPRHG